MPQKNKLLLFVAYFVFACSLILGIGIRLTNLFHTGFVYDTLTTQFTWATFIHPRGVLEAWLTYNQNIDYPPLNWFFLDWVYQISSLFGGGAKQFVLVLKSVYLVSDLVLIGLIAKLLSDYKIPFYKNLLVLSAILLYPGLWFVSGVWGQSDTFHTTMILGALMLLYRNKTVYSILGGMLLGVALWFKLQVLLVFGVLIIVMLAANKQIAWITYRKLVLLSPLVLIPTALGIYYLGEIYRSQPGLYLGYTQFTSHLTPYTVIAALGVLLTPVYLMLMTVRKSILPGKLQQFNIFLASFFGITSIVSAVFLGLNPLQWYRTVYEPLGIGVGDNYSGAANLSNLLVQYNTFFSLGGWYSPAKYGVLAIFVVWVVLWLHKTWRLSQNTLITTLSSITSFVLIYYIFSSGRVHSRYGHIALVFLLILLPFLKLKWYQIIGLVGVLVVYLCNQIAVYTAFSSNYQQPWLRSVSVYFGDDIYWWIVGLMVISGLLLLSAFMDKNTNYSQIK